MGAGGQRSWLKYMWYLTLYKDVENIGYNKLATEVRSWFPLGNSSWHRNVRLIRKSLSKWGETKIVAGDIGAWNRAAKRVSRRSGEL